MTDNSNDRHGVDAPRPIALSELADGAAEELWREAMFRAIESIQDLNAPWKDKREVILRFRLYADEERRAGTVEISCEAKLPHPKGATTTVYFGRHQGVPMAVEAPRQEDMFPTPAARPRPVVSGGESGKGGTA